jgi:hypothetical protein
MGTNTCLSCFKGIAPSPELSVLKMVFKGTKCMVDRAKYIGKQRYKSRGDDYSEFTQNWVKNAVNQKLGHN